MKNWVRRTWTEKSQLEKSTANGRKSQRSTIGQRSTNEDDVNRSVDADEARADVAKMMMSADQAPVCESAWQHVEARVARDQHRRIFERRMGVRAVSDGGEDSTNV